LGGSGKGWEANSSNRVFRLGKGFPKF